MLPQLSSKCEFVYRGYKWAQVTPPKTQSLRRVGIIPRIAEWPSMSPIFSQGTETEDEASETDSERTEPYNWSDVSDID